MGAQTSHPADWHLHFLEKYKICLGLKSIVCSQLHPRQKKKTDSCFENRTSFTLLLLPCSDDSFADGEMPETVMSVDQYLIISLTVMMQVYSQDLPLLKLFAWHTSGIRVQVENTFIPTQQSNQNQTF